MKHKEFGRYYPVIIDCETTGCDPQHHAILEIAYAFLEWDGHFLSVGATETFHILPFDGALFDPESMKIHNIDPYYPLRFAEPEKIVLQKIKNIISKKCQTESYERAILVGHNSWFDLAFVNTAFNRQQIKSPFHRFTSIDTATLGGFHLKETVLAKALYKTKISYDARQAHGALYDAIKTAELYCWFWNHFQGSF